MRAASCRWIRSVSLPRRAFTLCGWDRRSALADVARLQALRPLDDLELDALALGQRLETVPLDRGEVHEHVLATLLRDEAETLGIVEPLHGTRRHFRTPSGRGGSTPVSPADRKST